MSSCTDWTDALTASFLAGAIGYMVLKMILGGQVERMAKSGADVSDIPDPSWWNPIAHLKLLVYLFGSRTKPAGIGLTTFFLGSSALIALLSGGLLFLLLASSSHDQNACWRWLPNA